jgi:uncharacterized protein YbjT (DUF2867 family)
MNLTVFGASGGIGAHIIALATRRGHHGRAVHWQLRASHPSQPTVLSTRTSSTPH